MRYTWLPTRWHTTIWAMLDMERATLRGRQTMSSLQMGMISTENVSFELVVEFWMSIEMSCSEVLALEDVATSVNMSRSQNWEWWDSLDGGNGTEEIDHLQSMLLRRVEEIESVLDLLDTDGILVGIVLENELLKVQESTLVVDLLSDLDECSPGVLGGETSALGALSSLNDVLDLEDLLQDGRREDLHGKSEHQRPTLLV